MPTGVPNRARIAPAVIDMGDEKVEEVLAEATATPEPPAMIEDWVQENGLWVKKFVATSEVLDVEDMDETSGDLSAAWYEGRGKEMEPKWLNADTRFSSSQMQAGWVKVDPKNYKDPRYIVKNLPGLGECITFQDCFLCEMPKARAEALRKLKSDKRRQRQLARMHNVGLGTLSQEKVAAQFGDNASLINSLGDKDPFSQGLEGETFRNLPYDSPMAKEARALSHTISKHRGEVEAMNRVREREN